jgi:Gluconolactonase
MVSKIEIIAEDDNLCGEGPIWDPINELILWVDAGSSLIFKYHPPNTEKTIISRNLAVSSVALNRNGGLIVAGIGLHLWYSQNKYTTIVSEHDGNLLIFNDMIADHEGRIYAGTFYWGKDGMEKTGALYLIDKNSSVHIVDDGIKLSNGLGFSPDNKTLYYTDSGAGCIYKYDVNKNTGALTNKCIFAKIHGTEGIPDGLTVDSEGYVWSALWYGGKIVRFTPEGEIERILVMPVQQVSSVMFGGNNLNDLYITSASEYWPSNLIPPHFNPAAPMGGSLYRVPVDIQGKLEHMADFKPCQDKNTKPT